MQVNQCQETKWLYKGDSRTYNTFPSSSLPTIQQAHKTPSRPHNRYKFPLVVKLRMIPNLQLECDSLLESRQFKQVSDILLHDATWSV